MKFFFIVLFLTLAATAHADIPKVNLEYSEIFDAVCSKQSNYSIDPKWVDEIIQRNSEFQAAWDKAAPDLLQTTQALVGKPFEQKEFQAALSVCNYPSMSMPLIINIRYSLASFTPTPLESSITVSIIFHELIHSFLNNKILQDSKLLKKYASEDDRVKVHIHLLALMKAVYLKLNQPGVLANVIAKDQSLPNKAYSRAWEIVNDLEDYNDFIAELKQ
jgi:hypothetical protein